MHFHQHTDIALLWSVVVLLSPSSSVLFSGIDKLLILKSAADERMNE